MYNQLYLFILLFFSDMFHLSCFIHIHPHIARYPMLSQRHYFLSFALCGIAFMASLLLLRLLLQTFPLSEEITVLCGLLPLHIFATGTGIISLLFWQTAEPCPWQTRLQWKSEKGYSAKQFVQHLGLLFAASICLNLIVSISSYAFNVRLETQAALQNFHGRSTAFIALYAIAVSVLAPLGEEIVFRLCLFNSLRPLGKFTAMIATALLFACVHGELHLYPALFAIGFILQQAQLSGGLRASFALHATYNAIEATMFLCCD